MGFLLEDIIKIFAKVHDKSLTEFLKVPNIKKILVPILNELMVAGILNPIKTRERPGSLSGSWGSLCSVFLESKSILDFNDDTFAETIIFLELENLQLASDCTKQHTSIQEDIFENFFEDLKKANPSPDLKQFLKIKSTKIKSTKIKSTKRKNVSQKRSNVPSKKTKLELLVAQKLVILSELNPN